MATVELFITGEQIASFGSIAVSGAANGTKLTLSDVSTLGGPADTFRIEITDIVDGSTGFVTGQTVTIYAHPAATDPDTPLFDSYTVDISAYNGRATSASHLVLNGPDGGGILINTAGTSDGTAQIGPGTLPLRYEEFPFESLPSSPPSFPCFTKGTLIETDTGPMPIETLKVGDLVRTLDHGLQPIRWIGSRTVPGTGAMAPVTIEAGALGNYRRLQVSQQHRMLLSDWRSEIYFGDGQVLVAAKHLANERSIRITPQPEVTYLHLIFDLHEVIFAEGIGSESLHVAAESINTLGPAAFAEIATLFPELIANASTTARTCLRAYEGGLLAQAVSRTGRRSEAA